MLADITFHHIYSKSDLHRPIEFCLQALGNSIRLDLGLGLFQLSQFQCTFTRNGTIHRKQWVYEFVHK